MVFSQWIMFIEIFLDLSSYLRSNEQKLWYCNLLILVSQLVELKISTWVFSHEFLLTYRIQNIRQIWIWMSRTHFISFLILNIHKWHGWVKSHKKIVRNWKVFETIQNIKCEFWYVLNMITKFCENMGWFYAKTVMLVMQAKQWISCAKLKIWSKFSNSKHECTSWN